PSGRNIHLTCAGFKFWNQLRVRRTDIGNRPTATQSWKLIGACDPELRLSFENPRRGYTEVVVLLKSGTYQRAKLFILKYVPPLFLSKWDYRWCRVWRSRSLFGSLPAV